MRSTEPFAARLCRLVAEHHVYANGWYGYALDAQATARCVEGLRAAQRRYGRAPVLGELEVSVTPSGKLDTDAVQRLADIGVHRLIVFRRARTESDVLATIEHMATLRG